MSNEMFNLIKSEPVHLTMLDHRQGKAEATKHVPKVPKVQKSTKRKSR